MLKEEATKIEQEFIGNWGSNICCKRSSQKFSDHAILDSFRAEKNLGKQWMKIVII